MLAKVDGSKAYECDRCGVISDTPLKALRGQRWSHHYLCAECIEVFYYHLEQEMRMILNDPRRSS